MKQRRLPRTELPEIRRQFARMLDDGVPAQSIMVALKLGALRRWRGCPWRIGDIAAAALVLLHHEHHRTT